MFEIDASKTAVLVILFVFLRNELDIYASLRPCRLLLDIKTVLAEK